MKPATAPLPANSTYAHRVAGWQRYTRAGFLLWGVLTVSESRREGARVKTSRYVVQEITPSASGRRFVFHRPLPAVEREFVLLDARGRAECTCKGWTGHGRCKHAEAVLTLAAKRLLASAVRKRGRKPLDPRRGR